MAKRLLLLFFLLAACGPAPAPPTPAPLEPTMLPSPRPTAPPPATLIVEPTATPGAFVLWAVASGPQLTALQRLIADAAQQAGVEALVIGKTADGLQADIRANALAGLPPPDLFWATQDDLGLLQRDGLLQAANDGLADAAFIPATVAGATIDGRRWGTPLAAHGALFLLYNRRLVEQPPRTTDEMIVQARAQTTGGRYGLVAAWAEPRWFAAWLNGMGGAAIGPDGAPTLDTPQMIEALNLLKELRVTGPPPPSTYTEGSVIFQEGRAAFAIDGDWALAGYHQYTETLDLGIAPLPIVPSTGRMAAAPLGGLYLMYSASLPSARLSQAYALGRALAQPAMQSRIASDIGLLPAARAPLTEPVVTSVPMLAAAAAQIDSATGLPPIKGLRCSWDAIRAELPPVLLGDRAQQDAAQRMQANATTCMEQP